MSCRFLSYPEGVQSEVARMTGHTPSFITLRLWVEDGCQGGRLRVARRLGNTSYVTVAELHRFARARAKARKCIFSAWAAGGVS